MSPTGGNLSISLTNTALDLRDNPLHADLKIVSKNKTYHGHKVILYSRSKKWGKDKDLAGASVLDWTQWSDETIQDILDYTYTDNVIFLEDESYDDLRTVKLMSAATYFSLNHLVSKCELSLQKSKDRFMLPRDSVSVLTAEALQISSKNFRPGLIATSKRSVLRVKSIVNHKRARSMDMDKDHSYSFKNKKRKLEAVSTTRNEIREVEALANSGLDLVTEHDGRYVFTAMPRTDQHITVTGDNRCKVSGSVPSPTDSGTNSEVASNVSKLPQDARKGLKPGYIPEDLTNKAAAATSYVGSFFNPSVWKNPSAEKSPDDLEGEAAEKKDSANGGSSGISKSIFSAIEKVQEFTKGSPSKEISENEIPEVDCEKKKSEEPAGASGGFFSSFSKIGGMSGMKSSNTTENISDLFSSPPLISDHAAPSSSVKQITPHDRIDPLVPCSVSNSSTSRGLPSLVTMQVTASNVSPPPPTIIYTCNVEKCEALLHNGDDLVSHYTKCHPHIRESNMLMNSPKDDDGWIQHYGIEDLFKWSMPCLLCTEYIAYSDVNEGFMHTFMNIHFKQYHAEYAKYTHVFECMECWDFLSFSNLDRGKIRLREHILNYHGTKEVQHGSVRKVEDYICWKVVNEDNTEMSNHGSVNEIAFDNSYQPILDLSAVAAKFCQLDNVNAPAPWDPLSVYIMDINNSPKQYIKTVERWSRMKCLSPMAMWSCTSPPAWRWSEGRWGRRWTSWCTPKRS